MRLCHRGDHRLCGASPRHRHDEEDTSMHPSTCLRQPTPALWVCLGPFWAAFGPRIAGSVALRKEARRAVGLFAVPRAVWPLGAR